jgi:hypothetical protein
LKENKPFFLFFYHFVFTLIAYDYFIKNGGDAGLYWFNSRYVEGKVWLDFFNYGTDSLLFLNYPLVKIISLPIWCGFMIYSCIGFLGICQFYRLVKLWVGDKVVIWGINIIPFVLLMPNMHYWTSILGKEPLIFLFIATVILECLRKRYFSFQLFFSLTFLLIIRPHVALILVFSFVLMLLVFENWNCKRKAIIGISASVLLVGCFILFLKISNIKVFNWAKILRFNKYALLSLKDSNSYIPMIQYSYPEKLFAFYFRPLFFDIQNIYGFFISIENLLLLILHGIGIWYFIKYFRFFKTDTLWKCIAFYYLIAGLLFVQRYSDMGLIIRTKIMMQPFAVAAIVWLLKEVKLKTSE